MENSLQELRYVQKELRFGRLTDTPCLYFIPVIDINSNKINVPCLRLDITIKQFLEEYLANSSCQKLFKGAPCLQVAQGTSKGEFALDNELVSNYDLNFQQTCFYLLDSANISDMASMLNSAKASRTNQLKSQIDVKILFQSTSYPLRIKSECKLIDLKQKIIRQIPALKFKSTDMLHIQNNGFFLIDDPAPISKFHIVNNSVVLVMIKKKTGCFSRQTQITLSNGQLITIDKIRKGDKVLSFNQQMKKLESDQVTHVQTVSIKQAIQIQLGNSTKIYTTPNHMFLCDDAAYRCFTRTEQQSSLKQGSKLMLSTGERTAIKSILNYSVRQNEELFYHFSVKNNHNFIVNNLIAHNMFINVKLPTGDIESVSITPHDQILKIKQTIQYLYFVQVYNQKLIYIGKQLGDYQTIADYNIPKDATLQLQYRITETTNAILESTMVSLGPGDRRKVALLGNGDEIVVYNSSKQQIATKKEPIQFIKKVVCQDVILININSYLKEDEIVISSDSFLQAQDGQIYNVRDLCYSFSDADRPRLKTSDGSQGIIVGIAHHADYPSTCPFYKFITSGYNFIGRSLIVHEFMVSVVFMEQTKKIKKMTVYGNPEDTIGAVRQRISRLSIKDPVLANINIGKVIFIFNQKQLQEGLTLKHYDIQSQHVIVAHLNQSISKIFKSSVILQSDPFREKLEDKCIHIQVSPSEKYTIRYLEYRQKTVQDIIKQILPLYSSSYFFIYSNILLFPTDLLSKIEEEPQFMQYSENTVLMVKNQKLAFIQKMNIEKKDVKNYTALAKDKEQNVISQKSRISITKEPNFQKLQEVHKASIRIANDPRIKQQSYKCKSFYYPFLYLTCRKYGQKINRYITKFQDYKNQYNSSQSVSQLEQQLLYLSPQLIINVFVYGVVILNTHLILQFLQIKLDHLYKANVALKRYGIKRYSGVLIFTIIKDLYLNMQLLPNCYDTCFMAVANLRFGRYFKKGHTFYLYSFTTAYRKRQRVSDEMEGTNGTLFRVRSLSGKNISQFSVNPNRQEILFMPFTSFLVEGIDQRLDYDQVFLVEMPSPISFKKDIILWVDDNPQNQPQIPIIFKEVDIEILQATSTVQALKWIQQLGWLLNWKGLGFKLISDMGREQGLEPNKTFNKRAGIDLLEQLYGNYGVTVKTMIFCGNEKVAREMVKNANIPANRYFDVTNQSKKLVQFCKKDNK